MVGIMALLLYKAADSGSVPFSSESICLDWDSLNPSPFHFFPPPLFHHKDLFNPLTRYIKLMHAVKLELYVSVCIKRGFSSLLLAVHIDVDLCQGLAQRPLPRMNFIIVCLSQEGNLPEISHLDRTPACSF